MVNVVTDHIITAQENDNQALDNIHDILGNPQLNLHGQRTVSHSSQQEG